MGEIYGHQMVVDNRPGAGGSIGMQIAAAQPADGYTLVWGSTSTHGVGPNVYKKLPYDAVKDFEPVILTVVAQNILVVHPSVPAKNVRELISIAQAKRGGLSFASSGNGTISHLAGELFRSMTGADIVHVPYKDSSPALVDLLSGQIDLMFDSLSSSLPQVRAGKLRALGVTSEERSSLLPDVPTFKEIGFPGMTMRGWFAMFAPAGTPRAIVDRLNHAVLAAVASEEAKTRFATDGLTPMPYTPEQFAAFIKEDAAPWERTLKALNIQPQ
jgi:tripartite-type tricarboxylate transporter receptor subunit TctC